MMQIQLRFSWVTWLNVESELCFIMDLVLSSSKSNGEIQEQGVASGEGRGTAFLVKP
ncbi:hypothetical protein Pint_27785 [Pistacia integerrima]|uniref:Uncharacterized protein n=1 Tax=Pistacia integerrima TaxID=434235 RepID=A0ACC0YUH4_9ROSI|nr:hypothetical protein Pint_27785 [Pistacia integerrima]